MKRLLIKSAVAMAAVACVAGVSAQERVLKFGTANPKGHPIVQGMEKFADLVATKSGGKIKVNLFPGNQLGGDQQSLAALQGGTQDMLVMNSGILATVAKEFTIYDFPFMFGSPQEADFVVDGPFGKMMHEKLAPKGLVGLAYWELGFRNITNGRRPINKVEDIAGLKLRVIPNPINVDWVSALGANPTPMPFPEVYAGLESKAIDGQENPVTVIDANKFAEVQKHLAITNHQYNPQSVLISKKTWDALDAGQKKIISDAAHEAGLFQRKVNREGMGTALANLKAKGMQVTEFNATELGKFRDKVRPVIAKHSVTVGQDTVKAIQAELAKVRK